ncbi:hypothetical protein CORMATOL_00065 [Corynebacterium matruchotii ATCC 33806]|uniref:Uncharacterized protein n=1 Tax=Corynebacterium matruchotii ATCC 33806 TaxID=566549 RepID=C0DZ69_9CORY|nr:hypothetical protein CORMATOL_00065 [Corynebacterium matruchotii ATCC 33806]
MVEDLENHCACGYCTLSMVQGYLFDFPYVKIVTPTLRGR